ncbi:L-seryl-tRNA(Sec) kinase-like isoform X1 [Ictalurus furcatus]|uniref:L-seryl-tRNA(Sec) kinase-like isoform X1 n=1 Tax=Ictalurus furcatus TaxID=66913 RepID=UPI0023505269|nr:L-seryl-tRNA(Sec) kinase-like isoform X1 [Ictalurus furcatus]
MMNTQSSAGVCARARARACVCVLCGLPAVGKSTLTHLLSDHLHTLGWRTFIISYDELIPEEAFHFTTPEREEDEDEEKSKEQAGWKQHRQAVLECVDSFLQELSADRPHTHTAGGTGSVCEHFKEAMEKQQILPVLQNTHSGPQRLALLLDDNFYYHSMRYGVYQLARKHSVGFCEVYLHCPLEVCLHRNGVRGQPVPDDVITEMANRMEPPNTVKNQWEKNSVTVDNTHTVTHTHLQEMLQVISSAVENPLSPVQDDSEQREADRQRCACSVVHQVDQVCRRLVSQAMVTARACSQSGEEMKALARELSEEKSRFLQELRAQVLQQLGQDECVCVEHVVNIATDTFTRRTHVTMQRRGVHSTSSS